MKLTKEEIANRIGETRTMNNGQKATLIEWNGSTNITIQFENGYIKNGISYRSFKLGQVASDVKVNYKSMHNDVGKARLGEIRVMSNGEKATIVTYHNCKNIDIQFENGQIKRGVRYKIFKDGNITSKIKPTKEEAKSRIGETRTMKNGQKATIIDWNGYTNISIQFENGYIRHGIRYNSFQLGNVASNVKVKYKSKYDDVVKSRIGETNTMKNGLNATIIDWSGYMNVTIQFEDGSIKKGVRYNHFKTGKVGSENIKIVRNQTKKSRIGETYIQNDGHSCTIIEYISCRNCTIKFDDGTIKKHKAYRDIRLGLCRLDKHYVSEKQLQNYEQQRKEFREQNIGKETFNNNGQMMKIVEYNGHDDISVEFEDGTIVKNQRMDQFNEHRIVNPNFRLCYQVSRNEYALLFYLRQFGFDHHTNINGIREIDCYNPKWKIGIEYDGFYHQYHIDNDYDKNKKAEENNIHLIRIRDEHCPQLCDGKSTNFTFKSNGNYLNKNYETTIKQVIKYINSLGYKLECDINFERDKEDILLSFSKEFLNKRINEERIMNCGLKAKIIVYRSSTDVDILFENGHRRNNVAYHSFKSGCLLPIPQRVKFQDRIGKIRTMKNGLNATIVTYRNARDIDVQFEDGKIVKNKRYNHFLEGNIAYA